MAVTNLIPISQATADSGDFAMALGAQRILALTCADGNIPQAANARVMFKNANGQYTYVGALSPGQSVWTLNAGAAGTFRVFKDGNTNIAAFGVDYQET